LHPFSNHQQQQQQQQQHLPICWIQRIGKTVISTGCCQRFAEVGVAVGKATRFPDLVGVVVVVVVVVVWKLMVVLGVLRGEMMVRGADCCTTSHLLSSPTTYDQPQSLSSVRA
jgi:hypothetical protein